MPAAVEPEQPQSAHLHFAPPADWEVMPARPFDEALLSSLQSLLSLDGGRYTQALERYASAVRSAGDDLRIHNGLYLTNLKQGCGEAAAAAFGKSSSTAWRETASP